MATATIEKGAVKSPMSFGRIFGRRDRGADTTDTALAVPVETVESKSEHRKSLDGLRGSIREHVALLRKKAAELQRQGAEAKATAAALTTLASAFADVGEKLVQAGKDFHGIADKVQEVDAELARVDSLLESLDSGHADANEVIKGLTERVKKTAPTVH